MKRQLWFWVLVAIAAGVLFGLVAPGPATDSKWLADAFLQLIKTVTAPVIFVTVVIGIASLGDMARAGGLALRALGYFLVATATALTLGLIAGNLIKPGAGFDATATAAGAEAAKEKIAEAAGSGTGLTGFITDDLLPTSFVSPFVENEILRVLILAILVAAGISVLARKERERVIAVFETVSRILFAVIRMIMWAAPLGAFGGMAYTVAQFGGGALANLALLMVTFWGTCAVFVFGVLGLVARWSGFSIFKFVRLLKDELLIIVGTSSSETVLPRLLRKLHQAGASKQTVGVVLPTGYSFNLDGTCIYLTLGALFITQAAGQSMSDRRADRAVRADGADLQGRGRHHRRGPGDADRLVAGVRRHVLLGRVDRGRHRAGGRDRPDHERGPRADELHRQRRRDDGDREAPGRA